MTVQIELVAWLALALAVVAFVVAAGALRQHARIAAVEQRLAQMPTAQEVTGIRVKLASLEAKQDSVLTEVHGTRASIRRVEDFLLKTSRSNSHDSQF